MPAKTYPHNGEELTVRQIREMKYNQVSWHWIRKHLNLGWTVKEILDYKPTTQSQRSSRTAKDKPWGRISFERKMGRV